MGSDYRARLPPTPADVEAVEHVQRDIFTVRRSTEVIMSIVGENSFGMTPSLALEVNERIYETARVRRRCESALETLDARAVAAVGSDYRSLTVEAGRVMAAFHDVAEAARSSISQVSKKGGEDVYDSQVRANMQSDWEQLFALQPTVTSSPAREEEPRVSQAILSTSSQTALTVEANRSTPREQGRSSCSPAPSHAPKTLLRQPTLSSAALSLWSAREIRNEKGSLMEKRSAQNGQDATSWGSACSGASTVGKPLTKQQARKAQGEFDHALHLLRARTSDVRKLLEAHIWGFTSKAREQLASLGAAACVGKP